MENLAAVVGAPITQPGSVALRRWQAAPCLPRARWVVEALVRPTTLRVISLADVLDLAQQAVRLVVDAGAEQQVTGTAGDAVSEPQAP
jgi:hypothetical protein